MFEYSKTIDRLINTAIADGEIAGASLLVIKDGDEKYRKTYGESDIETQQPMHRDITVWDCLNMTTGIPYPCEELESGRRMNEVFRALIARQEAGEQPDTMEWMREVAKVPLAFQSGEKWLYVF